MFTFCFHQSLVVSVQQRRRRRCCGGIHRPPRQQDWWFGECERPGLKKMVPRSSNSSLVRKSRRRRNCVAFGSLRAGPLSILHRRVGSTKSVVDVWVLAKLLSCTCWDEIKGKYYPYHFNMSPHPNGYTWIAWIRGPGFDSRQPRTPLFSSELLMCPRSTCPPGFAPPSPSLLTFTIR
jgi:hypothetical protein